MYIYLRCFARLDNHEQGIRTGKQIIQLFFHKIYQHVNNTTRQPTYSLSGFLHEKIRKVAITSRVLHNVVFITYWDSRSAYQRTTLVGITEVITDSISVRIVILITLYALCAYWGIDSLKKM